MKRRFTSKLGRWGIALGAVFSISIILAITAWASGAAPFHQDSGIQTAAQKQAQLQQIHAQATAAAQSPHAPKQTSASTPVTSCPRGPVTSGISAALETGGLHEHIISNAIVAPNKGKPFTYIVYAGSLETNSKQGVIIVMRLDYDPCSLGAQGTTITYYPTLFQQGAVTLTQLSGVILTFKTATGTSGHFDVSSGHYSN